MPEQKTISSVNDFVVRFANVNGSGSASANELKTGRVMVKDEDVCLHCGLCAERCPTGAWDMKKYLIDMTHADDLCRQKHQSAA